MIVIAYSSQNTDLETQFVDCYATRLTVKWIQECCPLSDTTHYLDEAHTFFFFKCSRFHSIDAPKNTLFLFKSVDDSYFMFIPKYRCRTQFVDSYGTRLIVKWTPECYDEAMFHSLSYTVDCEMSFPMLKYSMLKYVLLHPLISQLTSFYMLSANTKKTGSRLTSYRQQNFN